jgi:hypothetical protein
MGRVWRFLRWVWGPPRGGGERWQRVRFEQQGRFVIPRIRPPVEYRPPPETQEDADGGGGDRAG